MKKVYLFAMAVIMGACNRPPPQPDSPAVVLEGGKQIPTDESELCDNACSRIHDFKCPEGDDHDACLVACAAANASGASSFDARCILATNSSAALLSCGVRCVQ